MALRVICDFDGTITVGDATDTILELFAAPRWKDLEALLYAGGIAAAECMSRQMALVDAALHELDDALDVIKIDPAFPVFCEFCRSKGIRLTVVSDGIAYFIRRILRREGLSHLPVRANRLIRQGERRFSVRHPHQTQGCASGAGTCKCTFASAEFHRTVLIGDGRSDFCIAHKADVVFAKKRLLGYTKEKGIPAFEYSTFEDVQAVFEGFLLPNQVSAAVARTGYQQIPATRLHSINREVAGQHVFE